MLAEDWGAIVGLVCLIIGLTIVAVLVSKKAGTAQLVQSFSSALDSLLQRATGKPA